MRVSGFREFPSTFFSSVTKIRYTSSFGVLWWGARNAYSLFCPKTPKPLDTELDGRNCLSALIGAVPVLRVVKDTAQ